MHLREQTDKRALKAGSDKWMPMLRLPNHKGKGASIDEPHCNEQPLALIIRLSYNALLVHSCLIQQELLYPQIEDAVLIIPGDDSIFHNDDLPEGIRHSGKGSRLLDPF